MMCSEFMNESHHHHYHFLRHALGHRKVQFLKRHLCYIVNSFREIYVKKIRHY